MINFSENIESLEEIILAYILGVEDDSVITDESGVEIDKFKLISTLKADFFTVQFYHDSFKHIKDFYNSYKKTPNISELVKMFELKNEQVDEDKIRSIKNVKISAYSNDFLFKYIKSFLMVRVLNSQINKVAIKLKTEKPDPDTINGVIDYVRTELSDKIDVDITNSGCGLDIYNLEDSIQKDRNTKSTGVEYLDIVLGGGYEPKTFIVFQGRAKIGKSMVMSNLAARAALLGNNVGIYTVELGGGKYIKRIGSNLYNIPAQEYNEFKDKEHMGMLQKAIDKFKEEHPNAGHVNIKESPTGAATVLDIENYYIQYEKKHNIKMSVIFVDYLNLLKPSDSSLSGNMYLSIKKICEELRKIAQRNDWCIVSATQIKTSSFSSDDLGLDSTAESSGLIATVDTLFGLMGQPDSPYLKMKCIANRDGGYMNSYANFVKDMNFFRLNEDEGDYMTLGEEAAINAENYKKYRSAPSKTYNDYQYKVMQNAQKQSEQNAQSLNNTSSNVNQAQVIQENPTDNINFDKDEKDIDNISLDAKIDNIGNAQAASPQPVIDEMPMGEVCYPQNTQQTVVQQVQQPAVQTTNNGQYVQKASSATNYESYSVLKAQAQPELKPVQQQQIVSTPPQNTNVTSNDTSTILVNNFSEAEKMSIIQNTNTVQSIVDSL